MNPASSTSATHAAIATRRRRGRSSGMKINSTAPYATTVPSA
ncbi:hypothetical protein J2S42_006152 [Catenuloplanes indicus]|uniref:Uncharacterized protein n=1 Tax=Catenuloplanes indicus TaxID=137267 RepID=A0AAE4B2X3_9ACTN|nr:hypothetical protein [Catenuloplanes indicus]